MSAGAGDRKAACKGFVGGRNRPSQSGVRRPKISAACAIAFRAGPVTEAGSSLPRHRVTRGAATAMARRTVVLSCRSPVPSAGRAEYLARSSAIAMRSRAALAGSARASSVPARVATARGDSLGRPPAP